MCVHVPEFLSVHLCMQESGEVKRLLNPWPGISWLHSMSPESKGISVWMKTMWPCLAHGQCRCVCSYFIVVAEREKAFLSSVAIWTYSEMHLILKTEQTERKETVIKYLLNQTLSGKAIVVFWKRFHIWLIYRVWYKRMSVARLTHGRFLRAL